MHQEIVGFHAVASLTVVKCTFVLWDVLYMSLALLFEFELITGQAARLIGPGASLVRSDRFFPFFFVGAEKGSGQLPLAVLILLPTRF